MHGITRIAERDVRIGEVEDDHGRRVLVATNDDEWQALAHIRGWCHNMTTCPVCQVNERHAVRIAELHEQVTNLHARIETIIGG